MVKPPGSPTNPLRRKYLKQILTNISGSNIRPDFGKSPKHSLLGEKCLQKTLIMPDKSFRDKVLEKIGKSQTNSLGRKRLQKLVTCCDRFSENMSKKE